MRRPRKSEWVAMASVLAVLVPLGIQVDKWLLERRQLQIRMEFEARVAQCETAGGRWWRGDCKED